MSKIMQSAVSRQSRTSQSTLENISKVTFCLSHGEQSVLYPSHPVCVICEKCFPGMTLPITTRLLVVLSNIFIELNLLLNILNICIKLSGAMV